ncbi:hypothetical protein ACRAWD_16795 [Caulobacter segnis]
MKGFNTTLANGLTFTDPAFNTVYRLRGVTSTVIEETYTGNTDLSWDGDLAGRQFKFQTGAKVILRTKSVDDTDYRYQFTGPKTTLAADGGLFLRLDDGRGPALQAGVRSVADRPGPLSLRDLLQGQSQLLHL